MCNSRVVKLFTLIFKKKTVNRTFQRILRTLTAEDIHYAYSEINIHYAYIVFSLLWSRELQP